MLAAVTAWLAPQIEVTRTQELLPPPDEGLFTGVVLFFLALMLVYAVLRALEERGLIDGPGRKLGRGIGRAMLAFGSFLQPQRPSPEDLPGGIEIVEDDHSSGQLDLDRNANLVDDGTWPSDGLRPRRTAK